MSKALQEARSFFNKAVKSENEFTEGFEVISPIQTPTIAIPIAIDLTEKEKLAIQKILVDEYQPGTISESHVSQHVEQLTNITKQIKSINAQSILLHGERIKQAQELLANYREGAFSKWLMNTYGNRQTPYSMLNYYNFYHEIHKDFRHLIEEAPKKAMYLLASREGGIDKKLDIIKNHGNEKQKPLIIIINDKFPVTQKDRKKPLMTSTIESMEKLCLKLESRSKYLSDDDRIDIKKLIQRLQNL